jgi:hypothetical protein
MQPCQLHPARMRRAHCSSTAPQTPHASWRTRLQTGSHRERCWQKVKGIWCHALGHDSTAQHAGCEQHAPGGDAALRADSGKTGGWHEYYPLPWSPMCGCRRPPNCCTDLHKAFQSTADAQDAAGDGKLCQGRKPQTQPAEQGGDWGEGQNGRGRHGCAAYAAQRQSSTRAAAFDVGARTACCVRARAHRQPSLQKRRRLRRTVCCLLRCCCCRLL